MHTQYAKTYKVLYIPTYARDDKFPRNSALCVCKYASTQWYKIKNSIKKCFLVYTEFTNISWIFWEGQKNMKHLLKSRGPILRVTSSETCSVCVKEALNTRPWLVNALVTWHISYKVTTLFFIRNFFVKQKDEAAPCKVDDHHLSSSNRGKKQESNFFLQEYFGHTILTMWKASIIRLKLL